MPNPCKLFIGALLLLFLGSGGGCSKNPDEVAIRAVIEGMRQATENKDFEGTLEPLTSDYSDNLKQTRAGVSKRLVRMFGKFDRLDITVKGIEVEFNGKTATVPMKVRVDGYKGETRTRMFGAPITTGDVKLHFEKRSGKWMVAGAFVTLKRGIF